MLQKVQLENFMQKVFSTMLFMVQIQMKMLQKK